MLLVLATEMLPRLEIVRMRTALAVALVFLGAGVLRRRREILSSRRRLVRLSLFGGSFALALLPMALGAEPRDLLHLAQRLASVAIGWGGLLWLRLSPAGGDTLPGPVERAPRRTFALALAVITFVALAVAHWLSVGHYALMADEISYLLQGEWLSLRGFGMHVDPELARFFLIRQKAYVGERIFTQYPPGWPATLAAFGALGLRWWSSCVLGAITVWITFALGRRVHSELAGAVAALLLATGQWFVIGHAGYMSHPAIMAFVAGGALCALRGCDSSRRRMGWWLGAGLLFGAAVAVRPVTGVALGASVVIWVAVRERLGMAGFARFVGWLALGSLAPVVGLLWYNAVTTGSPLTFGYQLVHGPYHDLGFGPRGYLVYDAEFRLVPATEPFTSVIALRHFAARAAGAAYGFLGVGLLIPTLLVATLYRYRWRWTTLLAFAALPAVYFFYWYSKMRFYSELLPFVYVGIAGVLLHIARRNLRLAAALLVMAVGTNLVLALPWRNRAEDTPWVGEAYVESQPLLASFAAIDRARAAHGRVVVFVKEPAGPFEPILERLSIFNGRGLDGDVVVARDLGAANAALMHRLPGHTPYRATWRPKEQTATVAPITTGGG